MKYKYCHNHNNIFYENKNLTVFEIVLNLSLIHNTAGAVYIDSSLEEIFSFRFFSFYFTRHICLLET